MNIASYIDHTILKPTTTYIEIKKICEEALRYKFAAVCVPPPMIGKAREFLSASAGFADRSVSAGSGNHSIAGNAVSAVSVKVATVIGFPFGYSTIKAKLAEVEQAVGMADELDVVINLIALRNGDWSYLEEEMQAIAEAVHGYKGLARGNADVNGNADAHGRILKVIIESGILSDEEIIRCCEIYSRVGVDFLKTSTGYAEKGASVHAVQLMRLHLPPSIQIKASGGIRSYTFARQLIGAGADRLGCSASVEIVREEEGADKDPSAATKDGY
ncbi:MAG TPA: deoxyribose-phosphate aldolase [Puia sp.]|nr:deoxyribose-phosphate aldolase [Puia sp.]